MDNVKFADIFKQVATIVDLQRTLLKEQEIQLELELKVVKVKQQLIQHMTNENKQMEFPSSSIDEKVAQRLREEGFTVNKMGTGYNARYAVMWGGQQPQTKKTNNGKNTYHEFFDDDLDDDYKKDKLW